MSSAIRINVPRLRAQIDCLEDEGRIAMELADNLNYAVYLAPEEERWKYIQLVIKADQLARYYHNMADATGEVCEIFNRLGDELSVMMQDYIEMASES